RGRKDHQDGGPRSRRRRSGTGDGAVRASVGRRRGAGLLRGLEIALQGERQRKGDRAARRRERAAIERSLAIIRPSAVAVAQLVESRIVIPVVVGSSPISHPTESTT